MSFRVITLACAIALCSGGAVFAADVAPNVVLIVADDMGWSDVGFNGRREWKTPNLDRLARQGTVFRRWYTAGVTCAPSRAALMTGRYGIHNGVTANNDDLPREEITLAEALKERGYRTALFGKWHHGRPRPGQSTYTHPMDHGFDEFFGFTNATHAHQKFPAELWQGRELKPSKGYADTLFADRAVEFLKRRHDRSFFLYLPFTNPHFRVEAPEEDVARHLGKFRETDSANPHNARYAAMIERLDTEIGRVLKTLDEQKLSQNTIVLFTSDHGATFERGSEGAPAFHDSNRPFRGHKRTLWEGGIRVPGVVRWPGKVPAGKTSSEIVHNVDVLPTLLAAAAPESTAPNADGRNLLGVWQGREKSPERTLFWEWRVEGYNQVAAMRGDMKLVITGETAAELYNVESDPAERISIAAAYQPLVQQLRRDLTAWLATESESAKWGKNR